MGAGPPPVPLLAPILCCCFVAAVVWMAVVPVGSTAGWVALGAATALGGVGGSLASLARRRRPTPLLLAVAVVGLALWRAASALGEIAEPWADLPATAVRLVGVVDTPVETRGTSATAFIEIERVLQPELQYEPNGRLRLTLPALASVAVGQRVEVFGRLDPVVSATAEGKRLLRRRVIATGRFPQVLPMGEATMGPVQAAVHGARSAIAGTIRRMLPEPHASLLAGLIVGSTDGMPDDFRGVLTASGASHLVVVSGYNITLVAGALQGLFRARRALGTVAPLVGVWAFTLLAGGTAPAVRAALMATLALLALRTGRGSDALAALGLTVVAMLLVDPLLIYELGFQLSVLATVGLIALQPRLSALAPWLPAPVREPVASTLAAQLATAPLLAATFHQLSLISPVANALAAPAIPLATIAGAVGVLIGTLVAPAAPLVGAVLTAPTSYLVAVLETAARIPGAIAPIGEIPAAIAACYAVALLAWAILPTPEGKAFVVVLRTPSAARPLVAGLSALLAAAVVTWGGPALASDPYLTVTVLDVGHGDAVFVRTPGQRTVLIDGGPNPAALLGQLGRRLGFAERSLTVAVLTRADSQRLPGIVEAVERYPSTLAVSPPEGATSALYQRWLAATSGSRTVVVDHALNIDLDYEVVLELLPTPPLAPVADGNPPQRTIIMRVVHRDVAILVAPSLTREAGRGAVRDGWSLWANALVVPRHGDAEALDPAFLAVVDPAAAIISVGARNRPGLPSPQTLEVLERTPTFRTDLHGSVELRSDGRSLSVVPERAGP